MNKDDATSRELLGMIVDVSNAFVHSPKGAWWECMFCRDRGETPSQIRHKDGCVIARAKRHLQRGIK